MEYRIRDQRGLLLVFDAELVASASSQRPGVPRWSELNVYRLTSGALILHKIGHSLVAHTPDCWRVRQEMPTWLEAGEEGRVHRVPCLECQPTVGNDMDPHTRLETQRFRVYQARSVTEMIQVVASIQNGSPELVKRLEGQLTTL